MDIGLIIRNVFHAILQLFGFLLYLLIPICVAIICFLISCAYFYLKQRYKEKIVPKITDVKPQKKTSIFKNLFVLFPKQLTNDLLTQNPNAFSEFGIHVVVGEQGSGKTMTVAYLLQEWKKRYPKMQIYTNMAYRYENGKLKHWKDLLKHNNGIYGVVNVLDEMKTWFSNKESKDLPPEVLGEICQQRKQKKATIGTVQVFSELAKPWRSQTHFIYVPKTFLGSLTIVFKTKAKWYNEEKDSFRRFCGFFIFAHTKELRESYDTFKKIERYKEQEFSTPTYFVNEANPPTADGGEGAS